MLNSISTNSRRFKTWRLFALISTLLLQVIRVFAHQTPNTLVFMDVNPGQVNLELQMPLTELELAYGNHVTHDPQHLIQRMGPQLKEYLLAHIHAYTDRSKPWTIAVSALRMDKGQYIENGMDYWELVATVTLTPQNGETTRKFWLDYDVIMHQVMNHAALVSVRTDWEAGDIRADVTSAATVINRDMRDNLIHPVLFDLKQDSSFNGFKTMVELGMEHIKEGTDHLLFLLTLLLPSTLVVMNKKWGKAASTRSSLVNILKIVTAFTIGHSITLLIGSTGWIQFPGRQVEVLIAVSILISAIHALKPIFAGKEMFIAAGFGLIHGMAFAQTLSNLHLDTEGMVLSILGFNIGIELMQLFVIAITIPWLILLSKTKVYDYVRSFGAMFSIMAAIAWIVERITTSSNPVSDFVTKAAAEAQWVILFLAVLSLIMFFLNKKQSKAT